MLKIQKIKASDFSKDFSQEMRNLLSTNKRNKIEILRLFDIFSKIWKMGESKENRRKYRTLTYIYIYIYMEKRRNKVILSILGFSTN